MKTNSIHYLVGNKDFAEKIAPKIPYEKLVCEFLAELSENLRKDKEAKQYKDILTFAFWIRKANINQLKKHYLHTNLRLGRGLIFHIAPSNVPINFAFSFVFGLLSGNGNIIRVSSKKFLQVTIICRILNQILKQDIYQEIRNENKIVAYDKKETEITDYFSKICDVRIIWGGTITIQEIRKSPLSSRAIEITFADRYSFGIIQGEKILEIEEKELRQLAIDFYNDTYLMDQNACSTPHLIFWRGTKNDIQRAKEKFWKEVYKEALKYDLSEIKVSNKYTDLCEYAVNLEIENYKSYENILYILTLNKLPQDITKVQGRYGLFFEYELKDYCELNCYINPKVQTCVYYGIEKEEIGKWIIKERLRGIDRAVPVGKALDIGMIWDGYDIISFLSRVISI